jgi:hypothetical protein
MPDRLEQLRAKLKARTGKTEYRENVKLLRAEIERLEALETPREEWR